MEIKETYGQQTIVNCMKIILYNAWVLHMNILQPRHFKSVLLCKNFILQRKHI